MARRPSKERIEWALSRCLNKAILACDKNPTLMFPGCPETTQLAARAVERLGYEAVVIRGTALTRPQDRPVTHIWVEIPELDLRVETNASQILGLPVFTTVLAMDDFEERYYPQGEDLNFLLHVTEAGERFYSKLAEKVARCVRAKGK